MVVGDPGVPVGNWSAQMDRSKLPPGAHAGLRATAVAVVRRAPSSAAVSNMLADAGGCSRPLAGRTNKTLDRGIKQ